MCWYDGRVWEEWSAGEEFKELHSEECVDMMGLMESLNRYISVKLWILNKKFCFKF